MKWQRSLWFLLALISSLFACQAPILKPVEVQTAITPQELVPQTKGGTLGQNLVPESKGGTLGQNLVPESKGGTLGKGLVPESKGGTLGRFTLRGQVVLPAGFRVQAESGRVYRLQLRDPQQKEPWLEMDTDPLGQFEIGNIPVETLLILEVFSTAPDQIPFQLWVSLPAKDAQTRVQRNLDLLSTAEGWLLQSLAPGQDLRDFVQAPRPESALLAQKDVAVLLEKAGFQRAVLAANALFAESQRRFQAAFAEFVQAKSGDSTLLGQTATVQTSPPSLQLDFQAPESGRSFSYGSAIPLQVQLRTPFAEPLKVLFYANGLPLKDASGQPLVLFLPAFSTVSQQIEAPSGQNSLAEWSLEARLLNQAGETLLRVSGPRISLYYPGSGGAGSQTIPSPPALNLIQAQIPALPVGLAAEFAAEGNGNDSAGLYSVDLHNDVGFAPGIEGRAFALNGSQGGVEVPGMDFAQKDYAVEVWFRTDFKQLQTLVKASPGFELRLLASGHLAFGHQPPALINSANPLNDHRWHHVVAVRQGNQEHLFVDGQWVQSNSSALSDLNSLVALHIGYQTIPNQQPFKGQIDQLRVYRQPLTETQIKTLFLRRTLRLTGTGFSQDLAQNKVTVNGITLELLSASSTEIQALLPDSLSGNLVAVVESAGRQSNSLTVNGVLPLRVDQLSRSLLLSGDALTVTGVGFDLATLARLSGVQGTVQTVSNPSLVVTVPAGLAGPGPLQLNNGGATLMGPWLSPMPVLPVAWWRGEGNAQDSMGVYPGTLQGAVQFVPGKVGQAFSLQAGAHVDLGLINEMQGDFTWTGWFRTTVPSTQTLISATQGGLPGLWVAQKNSQMSFLHSFPYNPAGGVENLAGNLLSNEWHHFSVVKNNLFQTLYIDGKSVGALDNATQFNSALQVLLGRIAPGDTTGDFQGALDEICLFNQALSSVQIEQIYQYSR
ncbi:MAG: LamG domain-containing protein [Candidatus Sericytochromatia bacterium]